MDFSTIQIKWKQECERAILDENKVDFSTIEITSKKVRRNDDVDFWTIEITSKKIRGNDLDISTSEITSKKVSGNNVKFVEIWSSTYRCNGFDVVCPLG